MALLSGSKWKLDARFTWILCVLVLQIGKPVCSQGGTIITGAVFSGSETLEVAQSPYLVTNDIVVERTGRLHVEPGTVIKFAPGVGITVRGALIAVGLPTSRITMTRSLDDPSVPNVPTPTTIRLVDGPSILQGRLQLYHKSRWRSVCTNSRNWTVPDLQVACRQLGFQGGYFFQWFDRNNDSSQLLYESPKCTGSEVDLTKCWWDSRQLGSGVCDDHLDLGIQCDPIPIQKGLNHWRGLRFEQAEYRSEIRQEQQFKYKMSESYLQYVDILYAGYNKTGNVTSALNVYGMPPLMNNVAVKWSAYNGINITSPESEYDILNTAVQENRGYGIFINSSVGLARFLNCSIYGNGGDGIRYVHHDLLLPPTKDVQDFCTSSEQGPNQIYPQQYFISQDKKDYSLKSCAKGLVVNKGPFPGNVMTIHFPYSMSEFDGAGEVIVRDGRSESSRLLLQFRVSNSSRPQSVTTTSNAIWIKVLGRTRSNLYLTMEIVSGPGKPYDLNVTDSIVSKNNGRGIAIENIRSLLALQTSQVQHNTHVAGVHVLNGSGDINMTSSIISENSGDGVNISYAGGRRNFTYCTIRGNLARGIAIWFNETSPYIFDVQSTVIYNSYILNNMDVGVLVGNFCGNSIINVTQSQFNRSRNVALEVLSCWRKNVGLTQLYVTLNLFAQNQLAGLILNPAVNVKAHIEYNQFVENSQAALFIRNDDFEELESLTASINVNDNEFFRNRGWFVASVGVSQYSKLQSLVFRRNKLEDNVVTEPFPTLNPRSRVATVVAISSSNSEVYRNLFNNPKSKYDLGSYLEDRYSDINGTHNWFGNKEEEHCFHRIFHSQDRYNLANIKYMPFLLTGSVDTDLVYPHERYTTYIPTFVNGTVLGGELIQEVRLDKPEYVVTKDIFVPPNQKLFIRRGTTLKFENSVGMMVQGQFRVEDGDATSPPPKVVLTFNSKGIRSLTNASVRLVGNLTKTQGRLQVRINNRWGTICNYGWTRMEASLACHQMGMTLNPDDWLLEPSEMPSTGQTDPVLLSNVQCREIDTDITRCQAEGTEEFEKSCSHENDVGIKCYDQTWAGARFGLMTQHNRLEFMQVDSAGVFDPIRNTFQPAFQVDMLNTPLKNVFVTKNAHVGVGIAFTSLYSDNKISNSLIESNHGHGLMTRNQGVGLHKCHLYDNLASGFHYNPVLSRKEERSFVNWIDPRRPNVFILSSGPTQILRVQRGPNEAIFLLTPEASGVTSSFEIYASDQSVLTVIVIGAIHSSSTEQLFLCDTVCDTNSRISVKDNLIAFPLTTMTDRLTLTYTSGANPVGRAALYIVAVERLPYLPTPTTLITDSEIFRNSEGISVFHYNRYRSDWNDRYLRVKNESIEVFRCRIYDNRKEGIAAITPHREPLTWDVKDIANITYLINETFIQSNFGGLTQTSLDLRNSNNVFHWLVGGNSISANKGGGIDIVLPYVWQPPNNMLSMHTFHLLNNTFKLNQNFKLNVDGYYAKVYFILNTFDQNQCAKGMISILGMEKEMFIERNIITENRCKFMIEFDINSHTDIEGYVIAQFMNNILQSNTYSVPPRKPEDFYQPKSYVIALRGVQKVNITNNIIYRNAHEYDLLAGIRTSSLDNRINAQFNYWGTTNSQQLRRRVFDFDDWNSFAIAEFSPFLREPSIAGPLDPEVVNNTIDYNNLAGRINGTVALRWRPSPYVIQSDVTIMPGAVLRIDPGVTLEFHPSVGILVLGSIQAVGLRTARITMRPVSQTPNLYYSNERYRRQIPQKTVRLCHSHKCPSNAQEGFVEVYNVTTLQWTPLCDKRFTERNAEVVCSEYQQERQNVFVKFGPRLDIDPTSLSRIRTWPEPRQCKGKESSYFDCDVRLNGNYKRVYSCAHNDDFVFVHCGSRTLPKVYNYWGGIRFSIPNFERKIRYPYDQAFRPVQMQDSILEYVDIIGAGILHSEKSAAVQSTFNAPMRMEYVNITQSASHGINFIAPKSNLYLNANRVSSNLGVGMSILVLNGDSGNKSFSTFLPLKMADIPYNTFGLVDICESHKVLEVEERVLVYYRYHNHPVDCVKIFTSYKGVKPLGLRLLQFNLFNSSESNAPDILRIFDGNIYSNPVLLGNVTMGMASQIPFFRSRGTTLSVQLHTSGATEDHGFVAEIVTLPALHLTSGHDLKHSILYSEILQNRKGGAVYSSTGDYNPAVIFQQNQFTGNGIKMYGNFTSCEAAVVVDVRNTVHFQFVNNLLKENQGGLKIVTESASFGSGLNANINNNLFTKNDNSNTLFLQGCEGVVQRATISRNIFARNYARYHDNIHFKMVKMDFVNNYIANNTGRYTMAVHGYEKLRFESYQNIMWNSFDRNIAQTPELSATILAGGTGQKYEENIFMNSDNDFEMVTTNRSSADVTENRIDASPNWWGSNYSTAISGRIRDRHDYDQLLEVVYEPYYLNNLTVVEGKCPPGWFGLGSTCFMYVGGVAMRDEAKVFCIEEGGSMPYLKESNEDAIKSFISKMQHQNVYVAKVWVLSIDYQQSDCIAYSSAGTERTPCEERLPFLCEKDPDIKLEATMDTVTIAMLGVAAFAVLLVVLCVVFWVCKSRQRQRERLDRRNSIRASKRSLRSIGLSNGSIVSDMNANRRLAPVEKKQKPVEVVEVVPFKGSFDSIEKSPSKFDSSSYFNSSIEDNQSYDICEATNHKVDYSDYDEKFENDASRPETVTYAPSTVVNPTFDFGYDNKAFLDSTYSAKEDSSHPSHWGSSSGTGSTADVKRYLETSLDTNGRDDTYTSRSTPSNFSQDLAVRRQVLETDM